MDNIQHGTADGVTSSYTSLSRWSNSACWSIVVCSKKKDNAGSGHAAANRLAIDFNVSALEALATTHDHTDHVTCRLSTSLHRQNTGCDLV